MRRKVIAILLALSMAAALLTGCGGNADSGSGRGELDTEESGPDSRQPEVLDAKESLEADETREIGVIDEAVVSVNSDIADLVPFSATSNGRQSVLPTLYEYLAYYDPDSATGLEGILMKEYEPIDGYTFQITIYDTIYDSAGNHITAEDVAFCFNTFHELGISGLAWIVDYCNVVDEYTVELRLMKDAAGNFENVICGQVPIVSKAAYEASSDGMTEQVVSTSPYIVENYVSGSRLVVRKNENYWQKDESLICDVSEANAERIVFNIITESSQTAINLETGNIDIAQKISAMEAARFIDGEDAEKGYNVFGTSDSNIYLLAFNMSSDSIFRDNQALRQAICYAIDTEGIVQGAAQGSAEALKAVGNKICVDYNPAWNEEDYYDYNLERANELLAQSGFDTGESIRLMCATPEISQSIGQIILAYLSQIGITVEIEVCDSALFAANMADTAAWDMVVDTRMNNDYVTTLSSVLAPLGDSPAVMNYTEDPKLAELAAVATSATGHNAETLEAYMQYMKEQAYVYGIMVSTNYYVTNRKVADVFVNYKGLIVPGACKYYKE